MGATIFAKKDVAAPSAKKDEVPPSPDRNLRDVRRELASASIDFNLHAKQMTLDDGILQDYTSITRLFEEAHDLVGIDGLVSPDGLFGIVPWRRELTAEAMSRGIKMQWKVPNFEEAGFDSDGVKRDDIKESTFDSIAIAAADGGFDAAPQGSYCDGCIKEMYHFLGAWLMEKTFLGKSIYKFGAARPDALIQNLDDLQTELMRQVHLPEQSFGPNMAMHGVMWQAISTAVAAGHIGVNGTLNEYPLELVERLCGKERVYGNDTIPGYDVAVECRHAVGHGVFMAVALAELGRFPRTDVKIGRGLYKMSNETLTLAQKICYTPPQNLSLDEFEKIDQLFKVSEFCWRGVLHSYHLASDMCNVQLGHNDKIMKGFDC